MKQPRPILLVTALISIGAAAVWFVAQDQAVAPSPVGRDLDTAQGPLFGLDEGPTTPEPLGRVVSPSGRVITPGSIDELGYVLPLDIRRPRPDRPEDTPPSAAARVDRRRNRPSPSFEEHRLGEDDGHTKNETVFDVFGDTLVAGWNNYTNNSLVMGVARSIDGGHTWSSDLIAGHDVMSDPVVKSGRNGVWYYGYIARGGVGGSDLDVFVRRSTDSGASWSPPVNVTDNTGFDDKPFMDADGDDVVAGYADFAFSPAKVRAARSIDGAMSFSHQTIVSVNSNSGNGAHPIIAPDGTWHIFWRDSFQDSLWVAHSSDKGVTWSPDRGIVDMNPLPSSLPPGFRIVNLPIADANPVTGTLIIVWNDQRFGDPDILSIRSLDGGVTWSDPIRVNDDSSGEAQFFPWITIDASGVAHVIWYDRRLDGFDIDVYTARSLDDGITFETNVRVTAESFTPVLPWESGVPDFIGDYNAVAASPTSVFPFYQDARSGVQEVYVAILPNTTTGVIPSSGDVPSFTPIATPNPWSVSTQLQFNPEAGARTVDIVAVDGRRVTRLVLDDWGRAMWDGRNEHGRVVPPGIYFAKTPGQMAGSIRLVKLP